MMKWPWVSRRAYDAVVEERNWLHTQHGELMAALLRVARHEAGLPELPRQPRQNDLKPMPMELHEHFAGWMDQKMANQRRSQAYRRHGRGEDWLSIMKDVIGTEDSQASGQ